MRYSKKTSYELASAFICLMVFSSLSIAEDKNSRLYRPVDNWNVDGANGALYVTGSLTESPCRLSMTSAYQMVEMGNTETAALATVGKKGQAIPFHIELTDCLEVSTALQNARSGQVAWSYTQPAVKIRFQAATVPFMPSIAKVAGIEGLGLELTNEHGQILPLDEQSNPVLLDSGQNVLTYYVTPVRTEQTLQPGAYSALISFEMLYE